MQSNPLPARPRCAQVTLRALPDHQRQSCVDYKARSQSRYSCSCGRIGQSFPMGLSRSCARRGPRQAPRRISLAPARSALLSWSFVNRENYRQEGQQPCTCTFDAHRHTRGLLWPCDQRHIGESRVVPPKIRRDTAKAMTLSLPCEYTAQIFRPARAARSPSSDVRRHFSRGTPAGPAGDA